MNGWVQINIVNLIGILTLFGAKFRWKKLFKMLQSIFFTQGTSKLRAHLIYCSVAYAYIHMV